MRDSADDLPSSGVVGVSSTVQATNHDPEDCTTGQLQEEELLDALEQDMQMEPRPPTRRVVLVPQSAGGTPQSIQDSVALARESPLSSNAAPQVVDMSINDSDHEMRTSSRRADTTNGGSRGDTFTRNRFSPLAHTADEAAVSGSDTESDVPIRRGIRLRMIWNEELHQEAHAAMALMQDLALRVGAIPIGDPMPLSLRRQRWSTLNVPLMWSAAGQEVSTPVLEWLVGAAGAITEPVQFHGGEIPASEAARVGWLSLRGVMRNWRIDTPPQLSTWLRSQGFAASRPGHHIPARAQEILNDACREDARVALLEAVYVLVTLHLGRVSGIPPVSGNVGPEVRRQARPALPTQVPSDSWLELDSVDLKQFFTKRPPMLKRCPYFLRGRLQQCFAIALRERYRARQEQDAAAEERAWKLFGLVPAMLLHRPRGTGSVGRDELAQRADEFASGHFRDLLEMASRHAAESRKWGHTQDDDTMERRGRAAQRRVESGAALAPKTQATFDELQRKRPQEQVRQIPPEVMGYVPEQALMMDFALFTKCLQSAPCVFHTPHTASIQYSQREVGDGSRHQVAHGKDPSLEQRSNLPTGHPGPR